MGDAANYRSGKVAYVRYASAGNYFTHATEAGVLRGRVPGTYSIDSEDVMDYAARPWDDAMVLDVKMGLQQTKFLDWKNIHLLSKGPHNLDIVTPEGEHFAFVPTTNNDYVTPNGAEMAGMTYQLKIPNKGGRLINANWKSRILRTQYEWQIANLSNVPSGGSGGSALGLTSGAYDPTRNAPSNFIYALYDGDDLGFFQDGISIEFNSGGSTNHLGQPSSQGGTATVTLLCQETAAAQLLARSQKGVLDKDLLIYTVLNEQINFIGGSIRPSSKLAWDDKLGVRVQTLTYKGEVMYPQVDINTSTNIATFTLA